MPTVLAMEPEVQAVEIIVTRGRMKTNMNTVLILDISSPT